MSERVKLLVDDAAALAERCWDAGFTVLAGGSNDDGVVVVLEPLGLEVEITSRPCRVSEAARLTRRGRKPGARREEPAG